MLCQICKKNDATVHITKIVNGDKYEFNVCEKCAKQKGDFNFNSQVDFSSPFTFQNILSGIMDYMGTTNQPQKSADISCSNCGITYDEFKQMGLVGCSECYESFTSTLTPVIKRSSREHRAYGKNTQKGWEKHN